MSKFAVTTSKPKVEIIESLIPKIVIRSSALIKMQLFVEGCTDEIGWLGTARKHEGYIIIDDVFLFDQEVHSTTTEITPEGLSTFAEELLQKENGIEIWNNMRVWGHSHVNMAVTPSGQDNSQMVTFSENGQDWFIRIIANKKGDIKIDLYDYTLGICYLDLKWQEMITKEESEISKRIKELQTMLVEKEKEKIALFNPIIESEIKSKVKKKTYSYGGTYPNYGYYGNYHNQGKAGANVTTIKLGEKKNRIKNLDDVLTFFSDEDVFDIGACAYQYQASKIITSIYTPKCSTQFNHEDLGTIYKLCKDFYNKTFVDDSKGDVN